MAIKVDGKRPDTTFCRWGHPWADNKKINRKGGRECIECRRLSDRRRAQRRRLALWVAQTNKLNPAQAEVLSLLGVGMDNSEIAVFRKCGRKYVENLVAQLIVIYGLENATAKRVKLALIAQQRGKALC